MLSWCKYQRQIYEIRTKIIFKNQQTVRTLEKGGKKVIKYLFALAVSLDIVFSCSAACHTCSTQQMSSDLLPITWFIYAQTNLTRSILQLAAVYFTCCLAFVPCQFASRMCIVLPPDCSFILFAQFLIVLLPSFSFLFKCTNWLTRMCFLNSVFTFCLFLQLLQNVQFG